MPRHHILLNKFCTLVQFGKDWDNENIFLIPSSNTEKTPIPHEV